MSTTQGAIPHQTVVWEDYWGYHTHEEVCFCPIGERHNTYLPTEKEEAE